MSTYSVGSIVESVCGKCNDVMGHTIMAMVGSEIVKVECRACKSVHRYRSPARVANGDGALTLKRGRDGKPVTSMQAGGGKPTRPTTPKAPGRKISAAMAAQSAWREAMQQHDGGGAREYSMTETFSVGDVVDHPLFGRGIVTGLTPPDKMDILFETETKRLLCNKG